MNLGESRFWGPLWQHYSKVTSIIFCRIPELEYASALDIRGNFLDHCCGDGIFASLAWPQTVISSGCDLSEAAILSARRRGIYRQLDVCDASRQLPYESSVYDLVFNNSALEHIQNLDAALLEVARVLKPGGEFAFNVLNHRYFEWWPLEEVSLQAYRDWQPFYHALSITEWSDRLARCGLTLTAFKGYFDRQVSQRFARLDYWFSGYYIHGLTGKYVRAYLKLKPWMAFVLKRQWSALSWQTEPDEGAGYFIRAVKS